MNHVCGQITIPKMGEILYALTSGDHVYLHTKEMNVGPLLSYRGHDGYYVSLHLYKDNSGRWHTQNPTDWHIARFQANVGRGAMVAIKDAVTAAWQEHIQKHPELLRQGHIHGLNDDISRLDEKIVEMKLELAKLERERRALQAKLDVA